MERMRGEVGGAEVRQADNRVGDGPLPHLPCLTHLVLSSTLYSLLSVFMTLEVEGEVGRVGRVTDSQAAVKLATPPLPHLPHLLSVVLETCTMNVEAM